ncbi:MAG: hypothetical protein IMZ54_01040 [Acidobacteria bacterium]|nr:hypothetical protein [Acidobacteriota bacterium]
MRGGQGAGFEVNDADTDHRGRRQDRFAFEELLARVRALLRKREAGSPTKFQVADLSMDLLTHKVMRAGYMAILLLTLSTFGFVLFRDLSRRLRGDVDKLLESRAQGVRGFREYLLGSGEAGSGLGLSIAKAIAENIRGT